jgi:ABC-type Fe3+-hydroxamate transport system substrate-binding protein
MSFAIAIGCNEHAETAESAQRSGSEVQAVSLSPRGTRLLIRMGLEDRIIAADVESARLLDRAVPRATGENLGRFDATVLLAEEDLNASWATTRDEIVERSSPVVIAPHNLMEALALYAELGILLGDIPSGLAASQSIGDPYASMSAAQMGRQTVRVAVMRGIDPLMLAPGHGFETDLVEIAGGASLTHDEVGPSRSTTVAELRSMNPDLIIVSTDETSSASEQAALVSMVESIPVAFLPFDPDSLWLDDRGPEIARDWARAVDSVRRVQRSDED